VEEEVDHQDVHHYRRHDGRAQQRGLAKEQQRGSEELRPSKNARVDVRVTEVVPGELVTGERTDGLPCDIR
jgi:hypothetical protein